MHSPDLRATVLKSAQKHPVSRASVAVALSGGVDSVVLLHVLGGLREVIGTGIAAIHVNHGLSPSADAWERACAGWCADLGIRFASRKLRLVPRSGSSLEADARRSRYAALADAAAELGCGVVALAHHADDQAETVLLQLLRGGPAKSLAAMSGWRRSTDALAYWRPLLESTRGDLLAYARAHELRWVEDESNDNVRFKRNFLRREILPRLEAGFPGYRTALARSAARAAEASALADQLADIDAQAFADARCVPLPHLRAIGALRAENLLRRMLAREGHVVPNADRLAEFVRQAFTCAPDRHPALPVGARQALRLEHGVVGVTAGAADHAFELVWRGEPELALPHGTLRFGATTGSGIQAARIPSGGLQVRTRRGGEQCRVAANRPTRTLKNLLQEAGIPSALRPSWPLLTCGEVLVAVPGVAVAAEWRAAAGERGWDVSWTAADRPASD